MTIFWTPINVRFFGFLLCFLIFLKLYLEKTINIAVVGNVPSNIFLKLFPEPQSFGSFGAFSEANAQLNQYHFLWELSLIVNLSQFLVLFQIRREILSIKNWPNVDISGSLSASYLPLNIQH